MTTDIIAETARMIVLKREIKGLIDVWYDGYNLKISFDCEKEEVKIQKVLSGPFLSNNLVPDILPDYFDEDAFQQILKPFLKKRYEDVLLIKREEAEEEEIRRQEESDLYEARMMEETEDYLNRTFGQY